MTTPTPVANIQTPPKEKPEFLQAIAIGQDDDTLLGSISNLRKRGLQPQGGPFICPATGAMKQLMIG